MTTVPSKPKIYHIMHLNNLSKIIHAGGLWSDAKRIELSLECDVVGMSHIKQRRLHEIKVNCHPGTFVGEFVPFYFCPRSVMLYILHMGNHHDIEYKEGQGPIVHLEADLHNVINWANQKGLRWAFSNCNAGARYVQFFNSIHQLHQVNWTAIASTDFRDAKIKEGKQAEFLIHEFFPWNLVDRIGVIDEKKQNDVTSVVGNANHQPMVEVKQAWYYL